MGTGIWETTLQHLEEGKTNSPFIRGKWARPILKSKGKWHYLYRAIDADGLTLDIWLRKKRDTQAAYAFLKEIS